MLDGDIELQDLDKTEHNRLRVQEYVETVLINQKIDYLADFVSTKEFIQHSPNIADGIEALRTALLEESPSGLTIKYARLHRVLAQDNFVLSVSEGALNGVHSAFYDLYRVQDNRLVEHWDTIEAIPPVSEWKNMNRKF